MIYSIAHDLKFHVQWICAISSILGFCFYRILTVLTHEIPFDVHIWLVYKFEYN